MLVLRLLLEHVIRRFYRLSSGNQDVRDLMIQLSRMRLLLFDHFLDLLLLLLCLEWLYQILLNP